MNVRSETITKREATEHKNAQVFNKLLIDNLTRYMKPSQLTVLANNDADHRATGNRLG
jgi:hypothetical protein